MFYFTYFLISRSHKRQCFKLSTPLQELLHNISFILLIVLDIFKTIVTQVWFLTYINLFLPPHISIYKSWFNLNTHRGFLLSTFSRHRLEHSFFKQHIESSCCCFSLTATFTMMGRNTSPHNVMLITFVMMEITKDI